MPRMPPWAEKLIAASVHTGEDGDRPPVIDRDSVRERQARIEIEIATPEVFQLPWDVLST